MYIGVQILVGVISEGQGMETKMDTLIYKLLVFELERYGLITEKARFSKNDSFEIILSTESDSGLAVICSYTTIDKRVLLEIELYDTRTMLIIASSSTSADLDLSFDKAVYSAVSELIFAADEDLTKRVVNTSYKSISVDKAEDVSVEITETELPVSDNSPEGGMEAFFNAGMTFGVGESQDIFTDSGFSMQFAVNYWLFTNLGLLGIGGQASAYLHPYENSGGSASLIMFPVGAILSWATPNNRLFSTVLQLGSGPAVAVLTFEGADPLVKVVPYISAGVFLSFNLRKRMSLGLKTEYHIYFEDTGILTTLSPSIYASFRSLN